MEEVVEARKKTGCRSCMAAFRDSSTQSGFTEPEKIEGLEEVIYSLIYNEASSHADNVEKIYIKKLKSADVTLTFMDVLIKLEAKIQGRRYSKGAMALNVNDKAVPIAIMWQETYSDGSYQNMVLYNVKLSRNESNAKTEGENIEFTSKQLTGKALPFTNEIVDGDIGLILDSLDPTVDQTMLNNFFKEVQFLKEISTIDVVYTGYTTGAVSDISIAGVTFDSSTKKFLNVPASTTTFTFKLDSVSTTATNSGGTWSFV